MPSSQSGWDLHWSLELNYLYWGLITKRLRIKQYECKIYLVYINIWNVPDCILHFPIGYFSFLFFLNWFYNSTKLFGAKLPVHHEEHVLWIRTVISPPLPICSCSWHTQIHLENYSISLCLKRQTTIMQNCKSCPASLNVKLAANIEEVNIYC